MQSILTSILCSLICCGVLCACKEKAPQSAQKIPVLRQEDQSSSLAVKARKHRDKRHSATSLNRELKSARKNMALQKTRLHRIMPKLKSYIDDLRASDKEFASLMQSEEGVRKTYRAELDKIIASQGASEKALLEKRMAVRESIKALESKMAKIPESEQEPLIEELEQLRPEAHKLRSKRQKIVRTLWRNPKARKLMIRRKIALAMITSQADERIEKSSPKGARLIRKKNDTLLKLQRFESLVEEIKKKLAKRKKVKGRNKPKQ